MTNTRLRLVGLTLALGLIAVACGDDGNDLSADAGDDFTVSVNEAPVFDGCGSTGDMSNFEWTITSSPNPEDANKTLRSVMSDCSFTLENAMTLDDVGEWVIELTVTAGDASATDQVVVQVVE